MKNLHVLPHSSTPAILSKTRLRMRLWTKRIRLTRAARPQKDRAYMHPLFFHTPRVGVK
jgi:hypothetical protein